MDRKGTCRDWCTLWKLCKGGEINPSLSDLNSLPPSFVLVILICILTLVLAPGLWAFWSEVSQTSTIETTIPVIWTDRR